MKPQAEIFEVGPRDGLQNEKAMITTADKVALVDMLSDCGFRRIEVASFVSPKWVPQMADGADVLAQILRRDDCQYAALTPNLRGYDGARAAKADEIAIFASASEGFSKANINCSVAESIERFKPVAEAAQADGIPMRGYVSCICDCPYDGPTDPVQVAFVAEKLNELGCYELSLGDTLGQATPDSISTMLRAVLEVSDAEHLAGHYHDTAGRALDNICASLDLGVRVFDASVGGLGGCPYAPGAAGNVDSLAVADMLEAEGYETGLDREALARAAEFAKTLRTQNV
ncbi:MAG: hydroxymethylglutaryl-CoA lyase [Rhodobacteraceae bacterium]|nr:hydroxymethylglutaryl-CoA lyase [Paracoccaceae bacterium]